MKVKNTHLTIFLGTLSLFTLLNSCTNKPQKAASNEHQKTLYSSEVIPLANDWNLILGDGSNVGHAVNFEHQDFFYATTAQQKDWVVFKAPNAGIPMEPQTIPEQKWPKPKNGRHIQRQN